MSGERGVGRCIWECRNAVTVSFLLPSILLLSCRRSLFRISENFKANIHGLVSAHCECIRRSCAAPQLGLESCVCVTQLLGHHQAGNCEQGNSRDIGRFHSLGDGAGGCKRRRVLVGPGRVCQGITRDDRAEQGNEDRDHWGRRRLRAGHRHEPTALVKDACHDRPRVPHIGGLDGDCRGQRESQSLYCVAARMLLYYRCANASVCLSLSLLFACCRSAPALLRLRAPRP